MNLRLAEYGVIALLALGGFLWLRGHFLQEGEQRCEQRYAQTRQEQQAKDKAKRAEDQGKDKTLAENEQNWHDRFDYLKSHPPTPATIVQTKTVIRDAQCSYDVSSLSADFLRSWNTAARGDTGTSSAH